TRGARDAVGVAGAKNRDCGIATQNMRSTVADGPAFRKPFHQTDPGMETENRLGFYLREQRIGVRQYAELKQTDAHGVEGTLAGQRFNPGAVVGMDKQLVGAY